MAQPPTSDTQRLAALRELLPATGAGIYLDTATAGPLPAETAAAMREADEWELRVGRAVVGREEDLVQRTAEARAVVAALLGGDPADISLTPGRGAALLAALWSVDWRAGDRLLIGPLNDQLAVDVARDFCRRMKVEPDALGAPDRPFGGDVLHGLAQALSERTRLVLVPDVAPSTGQRLPLAEISQLLVGHGRADGEHPTLLAVDASWSAGAVPVAVDENGADLVTLATDAWLLAPEGTAALWRSPMAPLWRSPMAPLAEADVSVGQLPRTTLLGLARSIGWLEMYVGLEWAIERGQRLARDLAGMLADIDALELLTPLDAMGTIVTFRLPPAWTAPEAVDELGRRVFAILRAMPSLGAVRASVAWFNTREELERLAAAVGELARHTPQSLPRRPSLNVP